MIAASTHSAPMLAIADQQSRWPTSRKCAPRHPTGNTDWPSSAAAAPRHGTTHAALATRPVAPSMNSLRENLGVMLILRCED